MKSLSVRNVYTLQNVPLMCNQTLTLKTGNNGIVGGSSLKHHTSGTQMNTSEHKWNTSEHKWNTNEHKWNTSEHK